MKTVPLKASHRNQFKKQHSKRLRVEKRIPAVVYGLGMKPEAIDINERDFERAIHTKAGENVVIQLAVSGANQFEKNVVIREIQHHPVTDKIIHVDFHAISLTEKIKVRVPVHVIGESPGAKEGGVLDVVHHEIEVECLPTDIPDRLDVDVNALKIGDSVHVREIVVSQNVKPLLDGDEVVVTVHAPKLEEEPTPEEVAAEPEVIGKEKEEGAEEAQPAEKAPAAEAKETKKEQK